MAAVTSAGSMKVALRQEGCWTFHTLNVPGSNFAGAWVTPGSGGRIHLSDGGAVGVGARFYTWRTHLDSRPPLSGQDLESNVDPTGSLACTFTLPEWWGRQGQVIRVRSVIIDFKRWNTGFAAHNHYDLSVTNLRIYNDPSVTPALIPTAATATFDETTSTVPGGVGASQLLRLEHNLDGDRGNGFQISLSNMQGVQIQKIVALIDVFGQEPRGI
jgi:hypothetical protein